MDLPEQIEIFRQFFELNEEYRNILFEQVREGKNFITIAFSELAKHSPELCELLLDDPEEILKAGQVAVEKMDLPQPSEEPRQRFEIRIVGLPKQHFLQLRQIRSKHLNKFVEVEGIVKQKSDVRPQVTSARFECPSCGNIIPTIQLDEKFKEPSRCGCGRKGKFKLLSKEFMDAQSLTLEESPEDLDGGEQPKRLKIFLTKDLVSPLSDRYTNPGSRIKLVGTIKEVPIVLQSGGQSTRFDLILDANSLFTVQENYYEIEIEPEEEKEIIELSQDPDLFEKLVASLVPTIYGHEPIKQALLLQMFGGRHKIPGRGAKSRGDIHVLLIGDPGAGKSVMLKRISNIAPKARFVSGKGASGAGLTAAVVKDDFLRGWTLEAGALVLANKGLACIDELDKMTKEDTSAMHEALEQQCYHYDTLIQFADGKEEKIGHYVEALLAEHKDEVIKGKDCFVLPDNIVKDEILTTDWKRIFPTKITRVSKHKSTEKLYKITFTHGRNITVTPEHPLYTIHNGRVATTRADMIKVNDFIPIPSELPIEGETQWFSTKQEDIFNPRASQHISVPEHNDEYLYRLVGYLISESSKEKNRGKEIGLNFTNKSPFLLADFATCMKKVFNVDCYEQIRKDENEPRLMLRAISTELAKFARKELPELLELSNKKSIPKALLKGKKEDVANMLMTLFEGDGHVSVKPRTLRIGYGTDSKLLAEQIQDLLLRFRIRSSITQHKNSYKVNITGHANIARFAENIGFIREIRTKKVLDYLQNTKPTRVHKDIIPVDKSLFVKILQDNGIKKVSNTPLASIRHDLLKKGQNISRKHLQSAVNTLRAKNIEEKELERLAFGDIRYEKVKSIEVVESDHPWTYDVTIEPTHTFISQGMVLHNTISISKANIQATLRCETTVLAAANPKFGRFDPYELISKQIDLPPALISRFDLIFPVRDMPDRNKDEKLASFILSMHKKETRRDPIIDEETIKRYVAYARQKCHPELSDSAIEEIKNYYVKMRGGDDPDEGALKPIPITARQLEALIRLSEASARIHLNSRVTKRDAQRAIELVNYCLQQIGMDPETGKIDMDRITTGISASARSHITIVKEILTELEKQIGKAIPIDDVVREAEIKGVSKDTAEDVISRLKRSGDVYSPKHGFVSRL